jgi:hypothetical protein
MTRAAQRQPGDTPGVARRLRRPRMPRPGSLAAALAALALAACAVAEPQPSPAPALQGGVLATFDVVGETFNVWVTNPQTIEQILALQRGESMANIPNAAIHAGPGLADHNAPWSWHLDPHDIEMAEMTMELCDGAPWYVEANLDDFTDNIGRYCPWSAQLVGVQDLRAGDTGP